MPVRTPVIADATLPGERAPRRADVWLDRGRIAEITPAGARPLPESHHAAGGGLLLPGFCDSHCHLVFAGLLMTRPSLHGTSSKAETLERLRASLDTHAREGALVAEGWDETPWTDGPLLREDLDRLSRRTPIVARRVCGHVAIVNTPALDRVPLAPDVDGARGRLLHEAAMGVESHLPGLEEERDLALAATVRRALETGITDVHEFCLLDDYRELCAARRAGRLPLRVHAFPRYLEWIALDAGARRGLVEAGEIPIEGLKLFADGTIGSRSAAVIEAYPDGGHGERLLDADAVRDAARRAHAGGYPICVHAIGDAAAAAVLDGLEASGVDGDRLEHAEILRDADVARMARLGVVASMQPNFVRWSHPGGLYARVLGEARARRTNRFVRLDRAGVALRFGSDGMPIGPLEGIAAALEHPDPGERPSAELALRAYMGDGELRVREGACAHLCLLSAASCEEAPFGEVLATWIDGRCMHARAEGPA